MEHEFKCDVCGDTTLCFHTTKIFKTPLVVEDGKFEASGKEEEIDIDDHIPFIRCGNGHSLVFITARDKGVKTVSDLKLWIKERKKIAKRELQEKREKKNREAKANH